MLVRGRQNQVNDSYTALLPVQLFLKATDPHFVHLCGLSVNFEPLGGNQSYFRYSITACSNTD